ncbi:helix-turn-helix domain-containing protein [Pseudomonas petrae]|uniref:Helix-turn-helix transcriptional regulator n=1 Tax=Pseudomonas petrae TaxID=2912190 RepID=A0ABS9I8Y2_9PSED|nr:helix-turn-helix transcriptional regulator [Pseudomonas petrae]MCF7533635.1 helix-turn-helix transcriptional regulator [Pseudomonas petrae]MCF7539619.1 helix-turn-helix transcriptional regulator [Pseudomonas petrae]MCF7543926.1 helix-turn-helix transcriptional regulator [Pseudomonas petrae]MCF7558092.1 helix-turn-helix transcriptional regulator [Pseudomonas petrae]
MRTIRLASNVSKELGGLLRYWRDVRGVSQLALSLDAGISQRQISFIESGRSVPGRQTLLDLAQSLEVPLRERNMLLLSAGYAPMYSEAGWSTQEMARVSAAARRVLEQQEPFPALVMDRYWNVLEVSRSTLHFFNCFIDMTARTGPRNMLHLIFDPQGLRPHIANWEVVARSLIQRVRRESLGQVIDPQTRHLLDALFAYPEVRAEWQSQGFSGSESGLPMVPLGFLHQGAVLNYFSMVSTVGTPLTVASQELRIECMFPADDATDALHLELMKTLNDDDAEG